jgi:hypothetical protein
MFATDLRFGSPAIISECSQRSAPRRPRKKRQSTTMFDGRGFFARKSKLVPEIGMHERTDFFEL